MSRLDFSMRVAILTSLIMAKSAVATTTVESMWPEVATDLTRITWAHGVNSKQDLAKALTDDKIMMLEADVSLGVLLDTTDDDLSGSNPMPIMAHPPKTKSDLSLEEFIDSVSQAVSQGLKKGIKLDFKDIEVVEPALKMLKSIEDQLTFPIWLNADIVSGPGNQPATVSASPFLDLCHTYFPHFTLSPGFTTGLGNNAYTLDHMDTMVEFLKQHHYLEPTSRLTFPLRTAVALRSTEVVQYLLNETSTANLSSVTLWTVKYLDRVQADDVSRFIGELGKDKVFVDLPEKIKKDIEVQ